MRTKIYASLCFILCASQAAAEDIRIKNDGDTPIYKLYAWASDLTPSTESVIVFPIDTGDVETVTIDNDWSDCQFTFLIDRNSPEDLRRKNYVRQDLYIYQTNICMRGAKPISLK